MGRIPASGRSRSWYLCTRPTTPSSSSPGEPLALTDPELDLLRELLEEDPTADAFLDVGRELVRREKWREAMDVLLAGLPGNEGADEGWLLLAQAAAKEPHAGAVDALKGHDAGDAEFVALRKQALSLSAAPAPAPTSAGARPAARRVSSNPKPPAPYGDPTVSRQRAEAYALAGRIDRAVRLYRRMLFHDPADIRIKARLAELLEQPHEWAHDDLSEELPDPSIEPPDLKMPSPYEDEEEITQPAIDVAELRRKIDEVNRPLPGSEDVAAELARERRENTQRVDLIGDDEITDHGGATDPGVPGDEDLTDPGRTDPRGVRRKRRSLIRK